MNDSPSTWYAARRAAVLAALVLCGLQALAAPLLLRKHAAWAEAEARARRELLIQQASFVAREAFIPEPDPFLLAYLAERTLQDERVSAVAMLDADGRALVSRRKTDTKGVMIVLQRPLLARGRKVGALRLEFAAAPDRESQSQEELQLLQGIVLLSLGALALTIFGLPLLRRWLDERVRKLETVQRAMERHLGTEAAREIASRPDSPGFSDRSVTILLCDIRNFTAFSEQLPPAAVFLFLNEFFARIVGIIHEHHGTVDKYLGDGVLAVFGTPGAGEGHATQALRCALDVRRAIKAYNQERDRIGQAAIRIGIALNTGTAAMGSLGTPERAEFTVVGDMVNLVSRMEGLNKELGTEIVLSSTTHEALSSVVPCRALGLHQIRGRQQGVELYEPVDASAGGPEEAQHGT